MGLDLPYLADGIVDLRENERKHGHSDEHVKCANYPLKV